MHSGEYLWLLEVLSNIWNKKKELEQVLFCKVKVTRADYTVLQEHLKEQHLDCDSPEYDGQMCNVLNHDSHGLDHDTLSQIHVTPRVFIRPCAFTFPPSIQSMTTN